jgi:hypothetical protein
MTAWRPEGSDPWRRRMIAELLEPHLPLAAPTHRVSEAAVAMQCLQRSGQAETVGSPLSEEADRNRP